MTPDLSTMSVDQLQDFLEMAIRRNRRPAGTDPSDRFRRDADGAIEGFDFTRARHHYENQARLLAAQKARGEVEDRLGRVA